MVSRVATTAVKTKAGVVEQERAKDAAGTKSVTRHLYESCGLKIKKERYQDNRSYSEIGVGYLIVGLCFQLHLLLHFRERARVSYLRLVEQ